MTKSEIEEYQKHIEPWDKNAMFKAYELLDSNEFNLEFEKHGVDGFFKIYDYSELTTKNIIKRLFSG